MKTISKLSAVLGLIFILDKCSAYKSHNEVCKNNPNYPTDPNNCDPAAYLTCGGRTLQCQCLPSLVWQDSLGKCTFTLHGVCTNQFGGPGWPTNPGSGGEHGGNGESPGCPENAFCETGSRGDSGRCQCIEGYAPNDDDSGCSGGSTIQNLMTLTFTLLPTYFIAMKMIL